MIIKNKIALLALLGVLNAGCASEKDNTKELVVQDQVTMDNLFVKQPIKISNNLEEKKLTKEDILINLNKQNINVLKSIDKVEIYSLNDELIGTVTSDTILKYQEELDNIYYLDYYGIPAYIKKDNVVKTEIIDVIAPIKKVVYATENISLIIPDYLSEDKKEQILEEQKLEVFNVYDESEDFYVVEKDNKIGYIKKENIEELTGTFVVVDISNQELKLYQDNEVIIKSPIVSGRPSSPSDIGLFEVYHKSFNRDLIGENYRSYVDVMMKYNGGEGLHDAEYHEDENGKKHGWRSFNEFGGDTYLNDGSHGCINMPHDFVMNVSNYVDIGTKVLVKK